MLRDMRVLAVLVLAVVPLAACESADGGAGAFGPQPQERHTRYEVWRTPYPVPFGTAGLVGIPPRPTHPVLRETPRVFPLVTPSPGPPWADIAEAMRAIPVDAWGLPSGASLVRSSFAGGEAGACPIIDRLVATEDVASMYSLWREALVRSGFRVEGESGPPPTIDSVLVVLQARSRLADAVIAVGPADPSAWPDQPLLSPGTRGQLVRLVITQRCASP